MMGEIPQWALDKAFQTFKDEHGLHEWEPTRSWMNAFARYIAAHEEPPVDPVEDIIEHFMLGNGFAGRSAREDAELLKAQLAKRGLEIRPVSA